MIDRPTSTAQIITLAPPADDLLQRLTYDGETILRETPELTALVLRIVRDAPTFEDAVARRSAMRLDSRDVPAQTILNAFHRAFADDPSICVAIGADANAILARDPAATRIIEAVLFFKGFHAIQTHRLAHWLWNNDGRDFALYLQSRSSQVFQTDIHPAASFGRGIFLDHATGLVVGATAVIEDDVSILHSVTLGGTGKDQGDRHPKIRQGVLIGAGAKILGPIEVGRNSRIAAGSVVLRSVSPDTTVAGIPAKPVGSSGSVKPSHQMDQMLGPEAYDAFTYII
ncbi:serine O-acetyltransferase [Terrarubrum flagellatum]|uniref:serine O-acetyltransferase n=1 Tax=Terrirubrum flagellatum TaxID=2895980 RepID=UPI0031450ED6